jgi:hypothetical protein
MLTLFYVRVYHKAHPPISGGILEQCMGARNQVGTELSYRPASEFLNF